MCVCLGGGGAGALKENLVELCSRSLHTLTMTKIVHFGTQLKDKRPLRFGKLFMMSTETMLRLYKAFILPRFYYCSMVWHFSSKQDSDILDLLNKRILRFIFKDFNSEYNNLLKKAGTANLKDKRHNKT